MQHPIAVEGMVGLQRGMQRILGVAKIDSVEIGRDLALDNHQIIGMPLSGLRSPRSTSVRVVVVLREGR